MMVPAGPGLGFVTKRSGPQEREQSHPKGPGRKEVAWSSSLLSERKGTPSEVFCHNYISWWYFCEALMNGP